MQLEGKVALITGSDSGIGQATAAAFAREGADVAITYHSDEQGAHESKRLVEAAGRRAVVMQCDVSDAESVRAAFDKTASELGVIDVLIANAGKGMGGMPVAEMEEEKLMLILRTNVLGPVLCAKAFVNLRKKVGGKGRIVFTGSVAGHLPTPGSSPYGMSKAAVNSLVRSLSREVADHKINVNAIAPGLIETPMTQERIDDKGKLESSLESIPWGRVGQPEEIAGLAVFLASDQADYITGQVFTMDGGLTMHWGGA